jgi:hypothetical protein
VGAVGAEKNPLVAFAERYSPDLMLFVYECLDAARHLDGGKAYDWQVDAAAAYDARERYITIRSGHGVGKSTWLSWAALHHILCRFPQRTAITAPTEKQLFNVLWADFKVWHSRLKQPWMQDMVMIGHDRAEHRAYPSESYITIATARPEQPEALQGVHSKNVLLIADEASGVPNKIFESAGGSMSGELATMLLAGNPLKGQGFFFDSHTKGEKWKRFHVNSLTVPGVSKEYAEFVEQSWGLESNEYRVRILGEFPTTDSDTIISWASVSSAIGRDITPSPTTKVVWGLDVARFGSDRSALAKRQGKKLIEPIRWWAGLDLMAIAAKVKLEYDTTPQPLRPEQINVDVIGLGSGVVDRLRELGLPVRGINVGESPATVNEDKYVNLRTELWFKGKEWFQGLDGSLPEYYRKPTSGDDLVGELTRTKYKYRPGKGNKIMAEAKDELKKRGFRSPDIADAFLLTLATDEITLLRGSAPTSWRSKIARPLPGLV